jgi:hypothetical protein
MLLRSALAAVTTVAVITSPAVAQSAQRWSLQASGIAVGVAGDAYDGLSTGYGGEFQVRVTPSLWSYGAGVQSSVHDLSAIAGQTISLTGIFFEPRRVLDIGSSRFAPYVSARLSYLEQRADLDLAFNDVRAPGGQVVLAPVGRREVSLNTAARAGVELSASGFQGNVGGGVLVKLSPRINLDLGLTLGAIRFGDAQLSVDGESVGSFDGTSGTGQNAVVRAGLAIGLGGGKPKPVAPTSTTRPRR